MNRNSVKDYVITHHFLERYIYRFQDNHLSNIFRHIEQMRKPTRQQYNRIKRHSDNAKRHHVRIDGEFVAIVINFTMVTCWRFR